VAWFLSHPVLTMTGVSFFSDGRPMPTLMLPSAFYVALQQSRFACLCHVSIIVSFTVCAWGYEIINYSENFDGAAPFRKHSTRSRSISSLKIAHHCID